MAHQYKVMLLFGPPGAGKGTQGRILGTVPGVHHLATGDMFRGLDCDSPLGQRVGKYSSRGELVPDELTIELWHDHLDKQIERGHYRPDHDLLLLDGIPRSAAQAKALQAHVDVLLVVHLEPSDIESMVQRMRRRALQENRQDDADEKVIRRRFEVYQRESAPVLDVYPSELIRRIDPMGPPVVVLSRVLDAIVPVYCTRFGNPLGNGGAAEANGEAIEGRR